MKKTISVLLSLVILFACTPITQAKAALKGDVNGDGKVTLADAKEALELASAIKETSSAQLYAADMDSDGVIDIDDVRAVLSTAADLDPSWTLNPVKQITPYKNNGYSEKTKFCVVNDYCGETFPKAPVNDKSSPLYSPLPQGTFDYVESGPVKAEGKEFYVLGSGRRIYANEVKVFTGYKMPLCNAHLRTPVITDTDSTDFYIALDWRVPFNAVIKAQSYESGYDGRPFNVKDGEFTGSYMDITFSYMNSAKGELYFPESRTIKYCKWIVNNDNDTAILRIYFRNAGEFYGYTAYYNDDNLLCISVKEPVESLKGRVIEIDPGHGGEQPGAVSQSNVYEREITYKIALNLKAYLETKGATVVLSRGNSSTEPEIEERRINTLQSNPDLFISIHLDSSSYSSANGFSVYYYKNYSAPFANAVADELPVAIKSGTGYNMADKGVHFYPFRVTRVENCPAILVECGFISNSSDFKIQNSANGQKYIAYGIYKGILNYFDM